MADEEAVRAAIKTYLDVSGTGRDEPVGRGGEARYDDGPTYYGLSILEFRDDKAAHETIYGREAWVAPEWRAPWRTAP